MKSRLIRTVAMYVAMGSGMATAAPVIALDPADGSISGAPGQTVGWGFTITSDATMWTSFVTSFPLQETNPGVGYYTDFVGLAGGPANFVFAPAAPAWVQAFDSSAQTGVGSFTIDPNAAPGSVDRGVIHVEYESFISDPNSCSLCVALVGSVDVPFAVQVVPEPGAWPLVATALAAFVMGMWRRRDAGGPRNAA